MTGPCGFRRAGLAILVAGGTVAAQVPEVEFDRDVRPLLAGRCFKCHGPDPATRKAGLRLDTAEGAGRTLKSGVRAIVPGQPAASALLARVRHADPDERMPPVKEGPALTDREVGLLEGWIAAGAPYAEHWAFVAPRRGALPAVRDGDWPRGPIDRFVLARLEERDLRPAPSTDRETLIRRVSLDLIGMPPTLDEIDAFVADAAPDAYERLVDRLLASPHYGEHQAQRWLDLARYADTNGYEKDRERSIWPWRDWVIDAINRDLPFDQFTIEQLAGDLLTNATREQIVATGFHRNTMLNQEGGIDVEEFRYEALVDRAGTTGTTWLGLTVACAQCHSHKYDPITQEEFFGLLAFFDNTDEIEIVTPDPGIAAQQREIDTQIAALRGELAGRFPAPAIEDWTVVRPAALQSRAGATLAHDADGVITVSGRAPERDTYEIEFDLPSGGFSALRVEAIAGPKDAPEKGPGRTPHGNFVLTDVDVAVLGESGAPRPVQLVHASADFAQDGYPVAHALDEDARSGWGIHGGRDWRVTRRAAFEAERPFAVEEGERVRVVLDHQWGSQHTLGRFRLAVGRRSTNVPMAEQRAAHLDAKFNAWLEDVRGSARAWSVLVPERMRSAGLADFRRLEDGSVLMFGNNPDRESTVLTLDPGERRITAIKLEALPHESLPAGGPGRSPFFPKGGFMVSEVRVAVVGERGEPRSIAVARASANFAPRGDPIGRAIDGQPDTGWTNAGNVGRPQHAVFQLAEPVRCGPGERLELSVDQHSIHNNNLGRFRVSVTEASGEVDACDLSAGLEDAVAAGALDEHRAALLARFCETAPELATARAEIAGLRARRPEHPTTLVFEERGPERARTTHLRHRGEFLSPRQVVRPHVPAVLPPLPAGVESDRLALARWLVDPAHPLVARVTVNREWQALFGRGLVATVDDFGTRGDRPTHPKLLDWLAVEFVEQGWSRKALHRAIVTSATYRQSAVVSTVAAERDPDNRWLSRAPRVRLAAESVRDAALRVSGLLSAKIGGPSVFPPQPDGVGDLSYGRLVWQTSEGEDRYRRGLYTFRKRTAPYAMFALFDAPSGETCQARRERTTTPLQALTLLNDVVFIEAARALGHWAAGLDGDEARAVGLFRRCLGRRPAAGELRSVLEFAARQAERLRAGELSPAALLGEEPSDDDHGKAAVWMSVARVLLNLDEAINRG